MVRTKFKKGAASFYVVAFSTLILLIIVASFTALVITQIMRSSNADLAQSAYDSALAGVEDAKIAFYNYRDCLAGGAAAKEPSEDGIINECGEIIYIMEKLAPDDPRRCDMVPYILGRKNYSGLDELNNDPTPIQESSDGNNMSQSYTCVQIATKLGDYRGTLSEGQQIKVVRPRFNEGISASDIGSIKISWGIRDDTSGQRINYYNFGNDEGNLSADDYAVTFNSISQGIANPPTISVALLQTAKTFKMEDFDQTRGNQTDRGMVYLVPTNDENAAKTSDGNNNYAGGYVQNAEGQWGNSIKKEALLKSNDRTSMQDYGGNTYRNVPYAVYCDDSGEYMCSATIELPEPVEAEGASESGRSDDTFVLVLGLPYGRPETDFSLVFLCKDDSDDACGQKTITVGNEPVAVNCAEGEEGCGEVTEDNESGGQALLKGMQVGIDSTGRANDLFRRVEVRLEGTDDNSISILGPLELMGDKDDSSKSALEKEYNVICEWNFAKTCE